MNSEAWPHPRGMRVTFDGGIPSRVTNNNVHVCEVTSSLNDIVEPRQCRYSPIESSPPAWTLHLAIYARARYRLSGRSCGSR